MRRETTGDWHDPPDGRQTQLSAFRSSRGSLDCKRNRRGACTRGCWFAITRSGNVGSVAASGSYILSNASVEVSYNRGVVYLDRCGSLLLKLQDQVGAPFEPNLPDMRFGELRNAPEHLLIQFGPKSFAVLQSWVRSPARVEQLAPPAWDLLADELGVRAEVTRCGAGRRSAGRALHDRYAPPQFGTPRPTTSGQSGNGDRDGAS